ncbi:MAG TPA: hypothetical protein VF039_02375 [Longimicrobiales bacterium]
MSGFARFGRAVGVGLVWAVAWAPVAVAIGLGVIDPDNSMDEMWVAVGAYPGFLAGVVFALLAGRRRLSELTTGRAALLGALSGLPVGLIPFAIGDATTAVPLWQLAGGFAGSVMALAALSAVASVVVARARERRRLQRA